MKVLKKKNKYEKVSPLPKGWTSLALANKLKDSNNKHQKSYARLADLLNNGWFFTNRESYKKAKAKAEPKSNKKQKNKKIKNK